MSDPIAYDIVIVGGGPAALAAAIDAGRAEMRTLMLERSGLGGQVTLTHAIDNYPGFPEGIPGPELMARMAAQAGVPLLGELPLDSRIREDADGGHPTVVAEPQSRRAQLYFDMARRTGAALARRARDRSSVFPNIVVEPS